MKKNTNTDTKEPNTGSPSKIDKAKDVVGLLMEVVTLVTTVASLITKKDD